MTFKLVPEGIKFALFCQATHAKKHKFYALWYHFKKGVQKSPI